MLTVITEIQRLELESENCVENVTVMETSMLKPLETVTQPQETVSSVSSILMERDVRSVCQDSMEMPLFIPKETANHALVIIWELMLQILLQDILTKLLLLASLTVSVDANSMLLEGLVIPVLMDSSTLSLDRDVKPVAVT